MNLLNALRRAQQAGDAAWSEHLGEGGVTPRQALILDVLDQLPGLSQVQIQDRTGVDRATVSDVIKRLLRAKLVERTRSVKDTRAYMITVTSAGRKALAAAKKAAPKVERDLRRSQAMVDLRQVVA